MYFEYFNNHIVIRFEKGEEIVSTLKKFCEEEDISTASIISCIGATDSLEIGIYDTLKKEYKSIIRDGDHEITSINGNITTMNGNTYLHLHITVADKELKIFGGHLNSAIVSATCELILAPISGNVKRFHDKTSGLNLMDLDNRYIFNE
jgi:predicted DNA-binding protein with PD1-like motif